MTQVNVETTDALGALDVATARMAAALGEIAPEIRARLTSARELLEGRMSECAREITRLEDRIRHADEDEDTSGLRSALGVWTGHRDRVRGGLQGLHAEEARLHQLSESLARVVDQGKGSARPLLARKLAELDAYTGVGIDGARAAPAQAGGEAAGRRDAAAAGVTSLGAGAAGPAPGSAAGPHTMRREVDGNLAWILPSDVPVTWEQGDLHWNRISPETATSTLHTINTLRPAVPLSDMRAGHHGLRDRLEAATDASGQRLYGEADLAVFDLYFGSDAIRIDTDGDGGLTVINGRHRLSCAAAMGNVSIPVSVSNSARRILLARGTGRA